MYQSWWIGIKGAFKGWGQESQGWWKWSDQSRAWGWVPLLRGGDIPVSIEDYGLLWVSPLVLGRPTGCRHPILFGPFSK